MAAMNTASTNPEVTTPFRPTGSSPVTGQSTLLEWVPAGLAGLAGLAGAAGLLVFYLGLITLAQGWGHAVQQFSDDRWFVAALTAGFGTQVGLFARLRVLHARRAAARTGAGGVAASTGTSAAAMLACCAHHLTDVFAVLGIAGAATFLTAYKVPLLWLGIGMNGAGIAYLVSQMIKARRVAASPVTVCH